MGKQLRVIIIGSGPAGLSAAARAAQRGLDHVVLEAAPQVSNTVFRYQRGKKVMAEPSILPLRAGIPFREDSREAVLERWNAETKLLGVRVRCNAEVTAIGGSQGNFEVTLSSGETLRTECVVLAIGLQGNLRTLGCPGEQLSFVQYQLDDPTLHSGETILIIGAGDAAIENALALAPDNNVIIVNRREEFDRARPANNLAILAAIESGQVKVFSNTRISRAEEPAEPEDPGGILFLETQTGEVRVRCDRVIARLGATPPREFVERCGVRFPSADPSAVPVVTARYESNVPGLYVIGALAGFPLIKQALNQGYEVIESILGIPVEPADEPLLRARLGALSGFHSVNESIERLRSSVPVLAPLTPLQLREFLLESQIHALAAGHVIFGRNDYSDSFYSVVGGTVEIALGEDRIAILGVGEFFGEMSLISGRRRSATVRAGPGCVVLETPRRSMNRLLNSVTAVKRVIDETFLRRAIIAGIAPGVPVEALAGVVSGASIATFRTGEALFREGDTGDALHLIRKGSVTISRRIENRDVVLAYVPAGQYVGEMALVSGLPRSASAVAAVATETIRVEGRAFKALMSARPDVRERVNTIFKSRLEQNAATALEPERAGIVSFLMAQGLGEATDVLLIDESLCTRCNQCEKACAETHGGVSRLDREAGPTYANLHVPTSCRHCEHPHCMKDCPPDAIHRSPGGEVYISDACIGCGNCERNCPYGVIQMGNEVSARPSLWRWMMFGGREPGAKPAKGAHGMGHSGEKKAVKCDMCKDLPGGSACVQACPTGAALRVAPEQFLRATGHG